MGPNKNPQNWYFVPVVCKVDGNKVENVVPKSFVSSFDEAVEYCATCLNPDWDIDFERI